MKIGDYIIIAISVIFVLIMFLATGEISAGQNSHILEVRSNGELIDRFILPLNLEKTYKTEYGENTILIKGYEAVVIDSDCPNKLCVKAKSICRQNESTVCVPNRFSVEILGETEEVDAIAN